MAAEVTQYCTQHTNDTPGSMHEVWQWTVKTFEDADKMSSPLQVCARRYGHIKYGSYKSGCLDDIHGTRQTSKTKSNSPSFLLVPFLNVRSNESKVLEIGSYSGYSALAWYEGTKSTSAEIITLELSPEMIGATRRTLDMYNLNDRVRLIEGPAQES